METPSVAFVKRDDIKYTFIENTKPYHDVIIELTTTEGGGTWGQHGPSRVFETPTGEEGACVEIKCEKYRIGRLGVRNSQFCSPASLQHALIGLI